MLSQNVKDRLSDIMNLITLPFEFLWVVVVLTTFTIFFPRLAWATYSKWWKQWRAARGPHRQFLD